MKTKLTIQTDRPQTGKINMAVDRQILDMVETGTSGPILRFYQWSEPTISLGYFQKESDIAQLPALLQELPWVKRMTGGGAILHDRELTYSLTVPLHSNQPVNDLYRLVHDIFIQLLREKGIEAQYRGFSDKGNSQRGPFFCFARHHELDIVTPEGKLLGSAQRRSKNAALQHGSLILEKTWPQQPGTATGADFDINWFMQKAGEKIEAALGYT
ncbi:MAG: lipoate--protein ligase family protein [Sedimentisphaerales bacterium]|nr:lipoate--protein ligase family protein [Sedimentisphaerales bacterium]